MKVPVKRNWGFTLVELLIVITILGILATAVLSAINPLEQLRKGRDVSRKADAATLLSAQDRFQATFGCYPWYWDDVNKLCTSSASVDLTTAPVAVTTTSFTTATQANYQLEAKEEIKSQFKTRNSVKNSEIYMFEDSTNGQLSVCFTPESKNARESGLGPVVNKENTTDANTDCTGSYVVTDADCAVCVPQ